MSSWRPDRREEEDRGRYRREDDRDRRPRSDDDDRDRRYDDDRDRRDRYDDRGRRDRRDDDYDEPRRRPSRRDEDDYDDDRPRRRKRRKSKAGIVVLICLLFGLPLLGLGGFLIYYFVSSGSKAKERLIGRWEGSLNGIPVAVEFNEDMTFSMSLAIGNIAGRNLSQQGKWSVRRSSKDSLTVTIKNPEFGMNGKRLKPTEEWTITFLSDDEIRITDASPEVSKSTFKRKVRTSIRPPGR